MNFSNPDYNIKEFGLAPGSKVVIFGSGAGGHTLATARALKGTGTIYGIDSRTHMIEHLKKETAERHLMNIRVQNGNFERQGGSGVGPNSCDAVIVPDSLFSAHSKEGVFKEAMNILKPGGRLLIVEWAASFRGAGPQPDAVFKEDDALKLAKDTGFEYDRRFSAGSYHYAIIFHKKAQGKQ